jgi:hypothetical protein
METDENVDWSEPLDERLETFNVDTVSQNSFDNATPRCSVSQWAQSAHQGVQSLTYDGASHPVRLAPNNMKDSILIDDATLTIQQIYEKYADDPYMLNRVHGYICHLPHIFENMKKAHHRRQARMEELIFEQDLFIQSFLNNNQYFYMASTEKFYYYDGIHYQIYNEDDILYNVLSSITRGGQLMSWKQRTRINVMKRIKDNNLLKTIPESETIQYVLDLLYPALFQTKSEAKYFLTIVGDNIFKKNVELIHFVHPKSKRFIQELNNFSQSFIGLNLSQTFKYKYHEHEYGLCRLVKMSEGIKFQHQWEPILNHSVLDLICVACHYSTRYNSSDEYILYANNDDHLTSNVFYLKHVNQPDLVDMFVNEYLEFVETPSTIVLERAGFPQEEVVDDRLNSLADTLCPLRDGSRRSSGNLQINWKNMIYLWKQFLDSKNLPTIMFQQTLKNLLIQKTVNCYDETLDLFVGVYSKHLPAIQKFLAFWEETITIEQEQTQEQEFEIDEICMLFKLWGQTSTGNVLNKTNGLPLTEGDGDRLNSVDIVQNSRRSSTCNITDKQIIDLISYFFPTIEIEREKFIYKIKCSLWDKNKDIQNALDLMKIHLRNKFSEAHPQTDLSTSIVLFDIENYTMSIYDAYMFYCKTFVGQGHSKPIVSKSYFEKYIMETMSDHILESTFISNQWIIS